MKDLLDGTHLAAFPLDGDAPRPPYCTLDNRIDGVVIGFTEVTAAKTLEAKLRRRVVVRPEAPCA